MSIFKFKWPYGGRMTKGSEVKAAGKPVAKIIDVEETEEGIFVTAEFYDPESKIAKTITGFDPAGLSIGPLPANPTLQDYAKADVEMTAALYGVHPEMEHAWYNNPNAKWGCAILILAALGFWFVVYVLLHWLLTGNGALFDWS